jgi:WD40 repeat protein
MRFLLEVYCLRGFSLGHRVPLDVLRGHQGGVVQLLFLPGGKRLVSRSDDRTVLVWDLAAAPPPASERAPGKKSQEQP